MKIRKRFVAWVLTGVMIVSSVHFPMNQVYAEEVETETETEGMVCEAETDTEQTICDMVSVESEVESKEETSSLCEDGTQENSLVELSKEESQESTQITQDEEQSWESTQQELSEEQSQESTKTEAIEEQSQELTEQVEEKSEILAENVDSCQEAINAYRKFLSTSTIEWSDKSYASDSFSFMIEDINLDGIPELFLQANSNVSHYEGYEAVYYYYNHQVVQISKADDIGEYYPQTGIVSFYYFGMGGATWLYQIPKNGKAWEIGSGDGYGDSMQEAHYEWEGATVSEEEFKKHTEGIVKIEINDEDWIPNTADNRERMEELARGKIVAIGSCGENANFVLDRDGVLTICGSGSLGLDDGLDLPEWIDYEMDIKKIVIEEGITDLGWKAFMNCENLTDVKLSSTVEGLGVRTFAGCSSLINIEIPESVTWIDEFVFSGCGIKEIKIPSGVTDIRRQSFEYCMNLIEIELPRSVVNVEWRAFDNCDNLQKITFYNPDCIICDYDGSNTIPENTIIYGYNNSTAQAYAEKYNRKFVSLGEAPESSTVIFSGYRGENVRFELDSNGVLTISGYGEMESPTAGFANYWVDIEKDIDYEKDIRKVIIKGEVTNISPYAFSACSNLINVNILADIIKIEEGAFQFCSSLVDVDIPSTVTELGAETFRGCGNLKDVKIPSGITRIQDGTFRDCNSLENMEIPSSVINIGNGAFGDCEGLKSIKILNPDCVISDDFIAPPDANILYGYAIPGNATIYGYNNSTAQAYAKKYNRKFITLMEQTENTIQSLTVEDMGGILNDTIKTTGKLTLVNNGQNSSDMLKEEVKKIQWISSDPEIAEVTECTIKNVISNLSSEIEICITPYQAGTVTITGITSDQNIKANCKIIVEPKLDLTIETEKDTAIIKGNVRYVSNGGEVDPDYLKQYMEGLSYIVVTNENATALEETASYEILTGGYGAEYTLMLKMVDNTAEIQPFEVQFISAGGNCWYLHATLCKTDGYFRIKVDSNNFDHEDIGESHDNDMSKKIGSAYVTSLDYYSKLVSGLSWDEEIAILSEMNVEEWTGSCFGASVSMALANLELFNVKALGAEDGNYYSLKSPMENEDLRDAINFYHLLQYRKDCDPNKVIYNDMKTSLHKWCSENVVFNQKSFWKAFLSAVYTNVENKRPMIFSMGYKDGDGEIRGHSVIVCGIDDTNSQYYNIKMYDLNNTYSYTCLQISKTFDKFWYIGSVDVSHNNWKFLHYMEYDTLYKMSQLADSIDAKNRLAIKSNGVSAPVLQNPSSIIVSAYSKFYLENSQGQYLSYDGTNYSGNIDIYGVRLVGENKNQKFIFTVEGDNQYKLSDFTDGISFGTIIDGTSYMTTASSANTITINGKDGISFSGSKIKFSGEISDNESYKLIKFNGLSESDVNIKKENKNVIAKSQNGINDLSVDLISNNSSKIHKDIKYGTDFNVNVDTGKIEYAGDTDSDIVENFTVIFNTQNDVTAPEPYKNIRKGSTITPPVEPVLSGYLFLGWYKDTECTVLWNFASDVVLSDMTLYAGWKIDENIPDQPSVPDDNYDGIFPEDIPADGRIPEGLWISEIKDYAYNGKPIKPTLRVYFSRKLLREGWDYTISYKNNIKAADAASNKAPKIIIKCKNDYTGTISSTFTIKKGQLTSDNLIYTETHPKGKMYTPLLVLNGNILKAKVDYIVTYTKNGQKVKSPSKSGIYEIHVIGKNSCEGDFTVPLTVLEGGITSITKAKVTIKSMTYGNKPPKAVLVVNGQTLRENTDYLVTYVNTDAKGTATAIFQGKGKYSGVVKKTFKVAAAKLPGGCITVTGDTSLKKGGAKPQITVQVNGVKLIAGVDYTVSYKNNKKAGKQATVIVKGKGNYSGSQKATFTVKTL